MFYSAVHLSFIVQQKSQKSSMQLPSVFFLIIQFTKIDFWIVIISIFTLTIIQVAFCNKRILFINRKYLKNCTIWKAEFFFGKIDELKIEAKSPEFSTFLSHDRLVFVIPERAISAAGVYGKNCFEKERNILRQKKLQSASEYRTNLRAFKKCQLRLMTCVCD